MHARAAKPPEVRFGERRVFRRGVYEDFLKARARPRNTASETGPSTPPGSPLLPLQLEMLAPQELPAADEQPHQRRRPLSVCRANTSLSTPASVAIFCFCESSSSARSVSRSRAARSKSSTSAAACIRSRTAASEFALPARDQPDDALERLPVVRRVNPAGARPHAPADLVVQAGASPRAIARAMSFFAGAQRKHPPRDVQDLP